MPHNQCRSFTCLPYYPCFRKTLSCQSLEISTSPITIAIDEGYIRFIRSTRPKSSLTGLGIHDDYTCKSSLGFAGKPQSVEKCSRPAIAGFRYTRDATRVRLDVCSWSRSCYSRQRCAYIEAGGHRCNYFNRVTPYSYQIEEKKEKGGVVSPAIASQETT